MRNLLALVGLLVPLSPSYAQWEEIPLRGGDSVWASSELTETLQGREVRYRAGNVFDRDPGTCWVEAAPGSGIGQSITFVVDTPVKELGIVNGFARNSDLFKKNNRIKRLKVYLLMAFTAPGLVSEMDVHLYFGKVSERQPLIDLQDTSNMQRIPFPFSLEEQLDFRAQAWEDFQAAFPMFSEEIQRQLGRNPELEWILASYSLFCLRLEITEVFRGSRYDDACLSELDAVPY